MRVSKAWAARLIGLCGLAAYPFLLHATFLWSRSSVIGTRLVWAELAGLAAFTILRFKRWRVGLALAMGVVALILALRSKTSDAILVASGIPHAAAYIGLLIIFATSLAPGRTPVISLLSETLSDRPPSPEMAKYTRAVTIVWSMFFALQLATSLLLFLYARTTTWSFFVNVLNMPSIIALFLCEYTYRRLRFPLHRHRGGFTTIRTLIEKNGLYF